MRLPNGCAVWMLAPFGSSRRLEVSVVGKLAQLVFSSPRTVQAHERCYFITHHFTSSIAIVNGMPIFIPGDGASVRLPPHSIPEMPFTPE